VKRNLLYVACLAVLLVLFFALVLRLRLSDITEWMITDITNVDGEILWQKSSPCLTTGYTTSHGPVAASNFQVLIHRSCYGLDGSFIALDMVTGAEQWYSNATNGIQMIASNDDFLYVFEDSRVRKVNYAGEIIWESQAFTSRSMRAVFPRNDLIYAPFRTSSDSGIYAISNQTGEVIQTLEDENVIAIFDDFVIRHADNSIEVIEATSGEIVWTNQIPLSSYNPQFFDIDRANDILFIYLNRQGIRAYNIQNGDEIRGSEQDSGSYPLLFEDRLFLYGLDNILRIYNPENGQLNREIRLSRTNIPSVDAARPESNVALAADHNLLSLLYRNTGELITLEISYPEN
jgi:outer membrane protein assembly factor BamB